MDAKIYYKEKKDMKRKFKKKKRKKIKRKII